MKKIIILATTFILAVGMAFAQEETEELYGPAGAPVDTSTKIISVEDKYADSHPKAKSVELQLVWTPLTDEVVFTYTCPQSSFDRGEAMNVAVAVYEEFAAEHNFKHKTYLEKDKTKYYKTEQGLRMATYTSKVVFKK